MQLSQPLKLHFVALITASLLFMADHALAATAVITNMNGTVSAQKPDGSLRLLSQHFEVDVGEVLTTEKKQLRKVEIQRRGGDYATPQLRADYQRLCLC